MNERIRRITEELWGLHEDLSSISSETPGKHSLERPVLSAFKAAVDHMRLLVWALIQGSRQPAEGSSDQLLNSVRAERVTEMLKALRAELEVGNLGKSPAGRTMLAEISSISNQTFDRYR
ncbi:MAG: hypothetical protein ACRD2Q_00105 [Terriglobales bacterium]